ncbi:MAG: tRNA (N6-isopentenyl adenosine(37)-C2)-methylthiotransferase MiaB [Firmicutes bacterium]|nr:tRNA (N6-isopentenyl adenosine(37)-C2)-methylthiotransferase MiaB [Bacillota bacterium]
MSKTYHIVTFGCQMNERDSETLAGMLEDMGYEYCPEFRDADVCVLNTCSVREHADKRFFGVLGQLKNPHEQFPGRITCVCGCMMQQQVHIDTLKAKYPWVDLVFGTHNIADFPKLFANVASERRKIVDVWKDAGPIAEGLPAKREYPFKAYVSIMQGCNNFCTYCIVPYTRGRERNRAPEQVLSEIRQLAASGTKEIMLLGQNVNSYAGVAGDDSGLQDLRAEFGLEPGARVTFPQLLRMIDRIEGIERVRFMTSHPKDLSDDLVQCFADLKHLCKQIHLPVQAGSDRVLKAMNRHYDSAHYLELIDKLRAACPDIAISTDMIVGFPGETEEDFMSTIELVRKVRYDSAFTFIYSVRKGTPAEKMTDQVPEEVKHQRFDRLLDVIHEIQEEKAAADQDAVLPVLVEGFSKTDPDVLTGRTESNKTVDLTVSPQAMDAYGIKCPEDLIGRIIPVKIVKAQTFSLYGEAV